MQAGLVPGLRIKLDIITWLGFRYKTNLVHVLKMRRLNLTEHYGFGLRIGLRFMDQHFERAHQHD